MATLGGNNTRKITSVDDVLHLYGGVGRGNGKFGTEIEIAFYDAQTLAFMNKEQNIALVEKAAAKGISLNYEPFCDGLEVASTAGTHDDILAVIEDTNLKTEKTVEIAETLGLKRSFFEQSPQVRTYDLLNNIIDNERYQAFFVPVRKDIEAIARYFVSSKSTQASVSYETPDHLLDNVRTLYFLTPFLFMLSANNAPFMNDSAIPVKYLAGMNYRASLGHLGGVPDYVFTAENGEDFIKSHIEDVLTTRVFSIFDHDGKQIKLPENQWKSLRDLESEGLNTEQNYVQVQSMMWRDVAIKPFRDERGGLSQHRYEARMFGAGMHQHATAAFIVSGLAFNPDYMADVQALLREFGFKAGTPVETKARLLASYTSARQHDNKFFGVPYGSGIMRDFAREFGQITTRAYQNASDGLKQYLAPLSYICETGMCDTRAHAEHLCNLEMVKNLQLSHNNRCINNARYCAGMYYEMCEDISRCA